MLGNGYSEAQSIVRKSSVKASQKRKNPRKGIFDWLRDQDSNLEPTPYTYPLVSKRGGLYHHPSKITYVIGCGWKALRPNTLFVCIGATPVRDSL